ncbi:MAG TPA: MdtA/MuxA family multidrug efflux RND transporter periplasmic adaptor subunit [Opitutaceae bacterium]|nr:MdtA/MuxA family multidrug efflux RND transporter periplasmic adaptor subunit [Opitutaceae bacterium]
MSQPPIEAAGPKAPPEPSQRPPTTLEKKRSRTKVLWTILGLVVLGTGALLYHRSQIAQRTGPGGAGGRFGGRGAFGTSGPLPVVVNAARKDSIDIILKGLGTVTPLATIAVRTQISGYLSQVKFTEGQWVNQGDVLAIIDPRPYEVALEQAQGQLLQAQAQYKEAQIDLDRYQTLSAQDSISKQQVDAQRALVAQYEGMTKTNQGAVDSAQLNLTYCHITAPVSGRIGLRLVDQGNYVTPGDASGLAVLTQMKPITVIFPLPEDTIPAVLKQQRAGAQIHVDVYNRDSTVKLATGTLSTVDNTVDPSTGMFKLRAIFKNEDEALFPNQFVNVQMLLYVEHGATVVPTSAIERGQQGSFVYVVGADNKVSAKAVTLGASEGERVAIISGISAGDNVVVDGADRLRDGMEVVVSTPAQPGAKPPGRPGAPDGEHRHWKPGGGN